MMKLNFGLNKEMSTSSSFPIKDWRSSLVEIFSNSSDVSNWYTKEFIKRLKQEQIVMAKNIFK